MDEASRDVCRRLRLALAALLLLRAAAFAADPKYGPAGKPIAVPLSQDHGYLSDPAHPAPDYWRLSSFYVPQANEYSCSVAAVTMALNALLNVGRPRGDLDKNITEAELLEKVKGDPAGAGGRHGVTLAQLESLLKAGLRAYGAAGFVVEKHEAAGDTDQELQVLRATLARNEKSPDDLLLVHFVQDDLTQAKGGPYPHVSPVGAYDAARRRVLIFDVDREWYEPYWVPDRALLKAMAHPTAAFGRGGYIRVGRDLGKMQ